MSKSTNEAVPATTLAVPTPFDPSSQVIHELHLSKDAEEWLKTLSPGLLENYKEIQSTWNHPLTQFSMTLVKDPQFRGAVTDIYSRHEGQKFLGNEALFVLFIWILRAWRLSKAGTWLLRIWVQAWVGALMWVGGVCLVPYLLWGDPYRVILSQLAKALLRHFFA